MLNAAWGVSARVLANVRGRRTGEAGVGIGILIRTIAAQAPKSAAVPGRVALLQQLRYAVWSLESIEYLVHGGFDIVARYLPSCEPTAAWSRGHGRTLSTCAAWSLSTWWPETATSVSMSSWLTPAMVVAGARGAVRRCAGGGGEDGVRAQRVSVAGCNKAGADASGGTGEGSGSSDPAHRWGGNRAHQESCEAVHQT
jgi:hypothetical protein